jgi:hypothetical protein
MDHPFLIMHSGKHLVKSLLQRTISKNKSLILHESQDLHNFMELLMKKKHRR